MAGMAKATCDIVKVFILAWLAALAVASPSAADACAQDRSLCAAARAGAAMLQTASGKVGQAPLKGRVVTLEAEVTSLTERVKVMMDTVGTASDAAALLGKEEPYAEYTALLKSSVKEGEAEGEEALTAAVAALETKAAELKSKILLLENQVVGSLLQKEQAAASRSEPTSLSSRVESLEDDVEAMRTKVTSLEQTISGLQTKSAKTA